MKVLWFTNTSSLYEKNVKDYNGGGWIESLEKIISKQDDIDLGISFFHSNDCFKAEQGGTTYYPISLYNSKYKILKQILSYKKSDEIEVQAYLNVIEDFKPDLIHVFGSENSFGLLSAYTDIPVIIHIQGVLNPCLNAYFAPGTSRLDDIKQYLFNPIKLFRTLRWQFHFNRNAKREVVILKNCKYFMGRTEWDRNICALYAPTSKYFHCNEALRDEFYKATSWEKQNRNKLFITSTISKNSFKGFDVILKTAKLLQEHTNIDFEWNVFGIMEYKFWEKKLGVDSEEVNVKLNGIADPEMLVKYLQNSDMFVHPSYIDNSPNSVCEAQLLGLPVIASNVGGVSSLIENNKTGVLVPANDPYTLAIKIIELFEAPDKSTQLGSNVKVLALERHDKDRIKTDLLSIYNKFLEFRRCGIVNKKKVKIVNKMSSSCFDESST